MLKWTNTRPQDKIDLIIRFWEPGFSTTDLADVISYFTGDRVTRNAIIGLYGRTRQKAEQTNTKDPLWQYPLNEPNEAMLRAKASSRAVSEGRIPRAPGSRFKGESPTPPTPVVMNEAVSAGLHLPLEALARTQCHWPTRRDDDQWKFCGLPTETYPYCSHHTRRAQAKYQLQVDDNQNA